MSPVDFPKMTPFVWTKVTDSVRAMRVQNGWIVIYVIGSRAAPDHNDPLDPVHFFSMPTFIPDRSELANVSSMLRDYGEQLERLRGRLNSIELMRRDEIDNPDPRPSLRDRLRLALDALKGGRDAESQR